MEIGETDAELTIERLMEMKSEMAHRGNWKEVKRINKMIDFHKR